MTARPSISPKKRFEIFKRDGFVCSYCGAHPPDAVLHVDHIIPVASGGGSDADNLTTACSICNGGKGARELTAVPMSLADRAADVAEREAQIRGYAEIMAARRERIDADAWKVIEEFDGPVESFRRDWFQSVRMFVERLGFPETLEAMAIARAKMPFRKRQRFAYFCGVCWRKIKTRESNGAHPLDQA